MFLKQIISAGGTLAIGRIVNVLSQFAFNALLVRVLLKQDVADFFLTFSLVSFFSLIVSYGGENIAIRKFAQVINQKSSVSSRSLLISFLIINLLTSLLVSLLIFAINFLGGTELLNIKYQFYHIIIMLCWLWGIGLSAILTEIFRAFGQFVKTMLGAGMLFNMANLILLSSVYLLELDNHFELVLCLVASSSVLVTIFLLFLANSICAEFDQKKQRDKPASIWIQTRVIFTESTASFLNKLGLYFTILADIWLVSAFFDKATLADYAIAAKLAVALSICLSIANGFIPTFIGRLQAKGREIVERFLRVVASIVALPTMFLFFILYWQSETIIALIFGSQYISAAGFLVILLLAQLINVLVGSCAHTLVMEGHNKALMTISLSTGGLAVLSALLCLSLGGSSITVAWAFTLSAILRNLLTYIAVRKLCGINTAIYINPIQLLGHLKLMTEKKNWQ